MNTAAFDEPWHAQVFALTVALNEAGAFSWSDWTAALAEAQSRNSNDSGLDGGADYYSAWLTALEGVLASQGIADRGAVEEMRSAWEAAYLATPHGRPVRLQEPRLD